MKQIVHKDLRAETNNVTDSASEDTPNPTNVCTPYFTENYKPNFAKTNYTFNSGEKKHTPKRTH